MSCYPDTTSLDPDTNAVMFYWVSRDSEPDGELSNVCNLWFVLPVRQRNERGAVWHTLDVSPDGMTMIGHAGRYTVEQVRRWTNSGAWPENDRELLVVGRASGKPQRRP